jgi:hypothetical protein
MPDNETKPAETPRRNYYDRFLNSAVGKPIVVVEKNNCIIRGTLEDYGRTRLQLSAARVMHKKGVDVPWIIVDRSYVAHVHPDVKAEREIVVGATVVFRDQSHRKMTVETIDVAQKVGTCEWSGERGSFSLTDLRVVD